MRSIRTAQLQAGDEEDQAFEQIDQKIPEEDALQPGRRRNEQRAVPAHVKSGGDRGEHARAAEMRRQQERHIGRHQRECDLDARILRPAAQPQADPADADPIGDFADHDERKFANRRAGRKRAGADRGDREAVENKRGGIIGQALALEHDDQPARQSQTAHNRERRHHVGRRHDCAKHEADRPRHAEQIMRYRRHRPGGEENATEREQDDGAQIETEFAPAHGDAGRINQRRQNAEQDKFRRKRNARQAGNERQQDAGNNQEDRRRGIEPPPPQSDAPAPANREMSGWLLSMGRPKARRMG